MTDPVSELDTSVEEQPSPGKALRPDALPNFLWTMLQGWGGRFFGFVISIILARLLSPAEFGVASAAALALMLTTIISEFGFSGSIIQRPNLKPEDINLPFYFSIALSLALTAGIVALAERISTWLHTPSLPKYLLAIAATMPLSVPSLFQEAIFKRDMRFRSLALRTLLTNIVGGGMAIGCALYGLGVWSFVVQAYVVVVLNGIWLWHASTWRPSLTIDRTSFLPMLHFGTMTLLHRILDIFGTRFIEILIIGKFNVAIYGVYIVGTRFYHLLINLFQSAFQDFMLSTLAPLAKDRERIAQVYIEVISLAATYISPIFILISALSPEICRFLFGHKWSGVEDVATLFLLLGAVHCVQFQDGPFLAAIGRPQTSLASQVVRAITPFAGLLLVNANNVREMTIILVACQLVAAPLAFYLVAREIRASYFRVFMTLAPASCICAMSFASVFVSRPYVAQLKMPSFGQGTALGFIFLAAYLASLALIDRDKLSTLYAFALKRIARVRARVSAS